MIGLACIIPPWSFAGGFENSAQLADRISLCFSQAFLCVRELGDVRRANTTT
jgi:hypothetical protein